MNHIFLHGKNTMMYLLIKLQILSKEQKNVLLTYDLKTFINKLFLKKNYGKMKK